MSSLVGRRRSRRIAGDGGARREVVRDRGRGVRRGGAGLRVLSRLVRLVTSLVVALIVVGIVLVLLKANPANELVKALRDGAEYLSKPFDAIFTFDKRRTEIAVNWGLAALVYALIGGVLARALARGR